MDIKNFVLSYYKNAAEGFHIQRVEKPNEAKKLHSHEYFQIYYIEKGALTHYVESSASRLVAGDMFIIPPGINHRIEEEHQTIFYSFSFMPDSLGESAASNSFAIDFLRRLSHDSTIRPKITLPYDKVLCVENIMEEIYKEFTERNISGKDIIRSYGIILVTMFARIYYESSKASIISHFDDCRQFVLHCVSYIENNYFQDIRLDSMVKLSAVSKSSFCKIFSEITGCSFNKYLNMCRIRKSTEYIKRGYKITAIYGLCGYNDFSTFYRNFKNIIGVSPREYAKGV
ncbi:MAG: helix-turn-helix transcriptional regulator [Clostridia bacterium]|nr:helix-turn-helix transcriptional regulator [Clostridia bacterium]